MLNRNLWFVPGLAIASIALVVTLLPEIPFLQDYMEWVYQTWLLNEHIIGANVGVCLVNYPVPNSTLFTLVFSLLALAFGWLGALKIYIVLYVLAFLLGMHRLITHWGVARKWQALVTGVAVLIFSFAFWGGFMSYQLSLLITIWFLARYRRDTHWSYIALYSCLAYLAHGVGVILILGIVSTSVAFDKFNRQQLWGLLPVLGLGTWYLLAAEPSMLPNESPLTAASESKFQLLAWKAYNLAKSGPYRSFLMWNGENVTESRDWMYYTGVVSNVVFVGLIALISGAQLASRWIKRHTPLHADHPSGFSISVLCLCCLVLHFIVPSNFLGIHYVFLRLFIPFCFLALITYRQMPNWGHSCVAVFCLIFFISSTVNYSKAVTQRRGIDYNQVFYDYQEKTDQPYFAYRIFGLDNRWDAIQEKRYEPILYQNGLLIEQCDPQGK